MLVPDPIPVESLRAAGKTFKKRTAAPDGCTPRQLTGLSDQGLAALAKLLRACEQALDFPESQAALFTALLETETGGCRPIGLYKSIYRLWAKIRQEEVRAWMSKRIGPNFFTTTPRTRAADAIYRDQFRALAQKYGATIETNWDLRKCFESVDRQTLWKKAGEAGYPMGVLAMSLRAYQWGRRLITPEGIGICDERRSSGLSVRDV